MKKETNIEKIKEISKGLLNIPILETEYSPMIVSHPFTKCGIVIIPYDDDYFQLNIASDKDSFKKWKNIISKQIDDCQNVYHIYYMINDSYRLMFVNEISNFLSSEDFSNLLGEAWVGSEYANEDANVSKKEMIELFKRADKKALMSESELETYNDLDDTLVVYRGVSVDKKNSTDALSWTTSFGKAKWFAERWGKGVVYAATIDKNNILAYFDRRNESEVVVDFNKLQNIRIVKRPQSAPQQNAME